MILGIVSGFIYLCLAFLTLFTSYLYYKSVNGEVRKIMIKKYLCLSISFFLVAFCAIFTDAFWIKWVSVSFIPYLYFKSKLLIYFVQNKV